MTATFELTAPLVGLEVTAPFVSGARLAAASVVRLSIVGLTAGGQMVSAFGGPLSAVTVNVATAPVAHGTGDCG